MKKKLAIAAIASTVGIAATIVFFTVTQKSKTETAEAKMGDLVEAVYGLGTVTAAQTYQLKIGVTATIRELFVKEGDTVRAGSPLLRIDESNIFKSPFAGTVTSVPFKLGETVYPQLPIITVMNLANRYIVVSLEQEGALRVRAGQTARMSVESLRGQSFVGKVRTLFPGDKQFLVHIDIPDLPLEVIPGMTGDVAIEVERKQNILLVPLAAVQSGRVTISSGHRTKKIQITVGAIDGRWAEVTSGEIKAGDNVLLLNR